MANQGRAHHDHVITVAEVELMEQKIKEAPSLLNKSAGRVSCCIFRVPQSLVEFNKKAYQPHIVSIGPYHHGKEHLKMIEEHKWRFLGDLLARTPSTGMKLNGYLNVIAPMERNIRECYSETNNFSSSDLIKMMVLDGLFIIELFCKVAQIATSDPDDPIFNMAWVFPFLTRDLLRLENQIPLFVLQTLFDKSKASRKDSDSTLAKVSLGFFNYLVQRPEEVLERYNNLEGKHLLDLFRKSLIPDHFPTSREMPKKTNFITKRKGKNVVPDLQLIQSATKLHQGGVRFQTREADSFFDINFHNGVLQIPHISIDDFTTSLFLNCVAFEQCYSHCSKDITAYTTFMGCLIDTPSDAGFLCDRKIMENYFGTDEEVAHFFNNVGKDVAFDMQKNYLSWLFKDVNEYYNNNWHVQWAGFKHTYFDTPWSFMSALAAVILLLLTTIQTFFAVYSYVRPAA